MSKTKDWQIVERAKFLRVGPANIAKRKRRLAELVSAAPQLYESLYYLVDEIYQSGCIEYMNEASAHSKDFNKKLAKAEKALAKARGEL
jgi:hypothetical protein